MAIDPGRLDRLLTLEDNAGGKDSYGEPSQDWRKVADLWCQVEQVSGSEVLDATGKRSIVTHKVTTRWRPGMRADMRLKWATPEGVRYLHLAEMPREVQGRRQYLEFLASEKGPT